MGVRMEDKDGGWGRRWRLEMENEEEEENGE